MPNLLVFVSGCFAFVLGMCVFSFVNVLIYRVPRGLNFVSGRSACPACGHVLGARDLVPVFSWLLLRGRCRYCGARIAARYTLVELLGGVLALACVLTFGAAWSAAVTFLLLAVLAAVAFVDADTLTIPNGFVLAVAALAVADCFAAPGISLVSRLVGGLAVSVPMLLLTLLVPGGFGGGDMKLMAACGLFLGWKRLLVGFFLAVLIGGVQGIWLLTARRKGRRDQFAFGPALCVGCSAAALWGGRLLALYLGAFRL